MTTVLVSELLFRNKTTIPVKCVDMKLNAMAPAGVGISAARKDGSMNGAKLSALALVIDAIRDKKVSALEGHSNVFVKYTRSDGTVYSCVISNLTPNPDVRYVGVAPDLKWEQLIPFVLLEARKNATNEEFKNLLNSLADVPDKLPTETVLKACDSFYYGCGLKDKKIDVYEEDATPETIQAAVRSGLLNSNHQMLENFGAPEVDLEGVKIAKKRRPSKSADCDVLVEDDVFADIRAGKMAIAYPWSDNQKQRIPSLKSLDDFVPTSAFWKGSRKIKYRTDKILERLDMGMEGLEALGKDAINFFMTGKPGTGKTTVAKALAAAYQIPFYSIPIQKGTEEGTFQGLLKAKDGKFVFTSTDFLDAFKNGGVIVLEELNLADPAILSGAIGQAIESPYYVMEDEIVPVYRHPLCIVIGTFNVGTAGSKEINPMLSSRFYQTYIVEDPSENEFEARLMKFDCEKKIAKKIYTAYTRILDYLKSPDVSALEYCKNVTFRGCVGAIQCMQEGSPFKEAIEDTLVGKIAEYDLELAHDVLKNVVEILPD